MWKASRESLRSQSGAAAIEYSLIAGCIALVIIATVTSAGADVAAFFQELAESL